MPTDRDVAVDAVVRVAVPGCSEPMYCEDTRCPASTARAAVEQYGREQRIIGLRRSLSAISYASEHKGDPYSAVVDVLQKAETELERQRGVQG